MKLVISQIYFIFINKINQPEKGVAVRLTLSSTAAEIFPQYFEDKHIKHLLDTKNVTFYVRYVDDILINYDSKKINNTTTLPLVGTKYSKT
jgi:hypothetical protein